MDNDKKIINFMDAAAAAEKGFEDSSLKDLFELALGEDSRNAALAVRAIRGRMKDTRIYAIFLTGGLPYFQIKLEDDIEDVLDKPVMPIFLSAEDAQAAIQEVPEMLRDSCSVSVLGAGRGIDIFVDIWRLGPRAICLDEVDLDTDALTYPVRNKGKSYFAIAPDVQAALAIMMQCMILGREDDAAIARNFAAIAAAQGYLGVALKHEEVQADQFRPLTNKDIGDAEGPSVIMAYTDWYCFSQDFKAEDIDIGITSWDNLVVQDSSININGLITISAESAMEFQMFSLRGRMARALISANLGVTSEARTEAVFRDIQNSRQLAAEFLGGLSYNKEADTVSFNFPNGTPVMVDGMSAKQLYDASICTSPSAAYHVLALLEQESDPEGPMHTSFNNGTLFE